MKALLRSYNGEPFVYVDVVYKNCNFYLKDGTTIVRQKDIIDTIYDNRKNYVTCRVCGKMVKNNQESIENHWEEMAKKKDCFKCNLLLETYRETSSESKKYKRVEKNSEQYFVTKKYKAVLRCNNSWRHQPLINTPEADETCVFYKCRNAAYDEISDHFTRYPHAFDVLPTVDMLVQKRWKYSKALNAHSANNAMLMYHHPTMTTLTTLVNSKGIVDSFELKTGNYINRMMYSKKYDKFFYIGARVYQNDPVNHIENSRRASAEAKVKELFNEVN